MPPCLIGNGTIDFDEFVVMMQKKKHGPINREDELLEAFKTFDQVRPFGELSSHVLQDGD